MTWAAESTAMPVFEHETYVDAPVERVWTFHSSVEGLKALTPGFLGLEVLEVRGPDGTVKPPSAELVEGSRASMRLAPLGFGPSLSWTSEIVERGERQGEAYFVDEMVRGPFDRWRHRHDFTSEDNGTRVVDRLEYSLPWWLMGRLGSPAFELQLKMLFRYRARKLKERVE